METFWARVNKTDSCWLWTGGRNPKGYGLSKFQGRYQGTHRIAWTLTHGSIPPNTMVLHRCDVPACVNPDHLFLGNASINTLDAIAKGRWKSPNPKRTHCKRGHLYDGVIQRKGFTEHVCLKCKAQIKRKQRAVAKQRKALML